MKKKLLISTVLFLSIVLGGCNFLNIVPNFQTATTASTTVEQLTNISLNQETVNLNLNGFVSFQLVATVTSEEEIDKSISWESSDSTFVEVSKTGLLTAKQVTSENIIITASLTNSNDIKATCEVSVVNTEPIYTAVKVTPSTTSLDLYNNKTIQLSAVVEGENAPSQDVTWSSSNSKTATVENGLVTALKTGKVTITAKAAKKTNIKGTCVITITDSTPPTIDSFSISKNALSLKPGRSETLTATVSGSHNPDLSVTWSTNNPAVADVNNGKVEVPASATPGSKATITATSNQDPTKFAKCEITVLEPTALSKYTIMVYSCGADLESETIAKGGGQASADIQEMLNVALPDDVNIVIETGGAKAWRRFDISANNLERYEIVDQQLVKQASLPNASMGKVETLQSFIEWGLDNYPAEQTGLIMWNHGGAMNGVCFDENFIDQDAYDYFYDQGYEFETNDGITASELVSAVSGAFSSLGRPKTNKLTWVGYDACMMAVADIASVNAEYFDYMIAAQELENGTGWDYDEWLPTLVNNPSVDPVTLLSKICDTFIAENNAYGASSNDQTLAVYDLSKMDAFTTAFNSYTSKFTKSNWTNLKTCYQNSRRFGSTGSDEPYLNGIADAKSFLTKTKSKFSSYSTTDVENALNDLVVYNKFGAYYTSNKPCGINLFMAMDTTSGGYPPQTMSFHYTEKDTKFTYWRALNIQNGTFFDD